ncbi:hypothetical protein Sulku_1713 [Sulfuricurvum kujiense DSM 16994]|uniref:Uncharacterized protein n=1 Tax=Sulfuricurvum kujiense (strain ATCC BAA-921 / DSM 16994 / JCM 11577 / YK-1) TaxID=709032 RepID=E4U0X2_SULKY|nr:hypothetical protein [Sulfuricurvum kujiense]ADR34374.1 hypothetical protein Sulku_1713 [Sulfuricurvum kujiense DSM 16994]
MATKYPTPNFIIDKDYQTWLDRKAMAHRKRDGNQFTKEQYKQAIHKAVVLSEGCDFYTGEMLEWGLLGTFGNEENGIKNYKKEPKLPTVDHLNGRSNIDLLFVVTGWAVNDAKNDLSYEEFLILCEKVLNQKGKCISDLKKLQK